jgi:hypothetical protein
MEYGLVINIVQIKTNTNFRRFYTNNSLSSGERFGPKNINDQTEAS